MRNTDLLSGDYYHICNRGVDRRTIFRGQADYKRFYQYLFLFSDSLYNNPHARPLFNEEKLSLAGKFIEERKPLVDILAYNLRPNHFHLFLRQRLDGGISIFLHKLQKTYSRWFNISEQRTGTLFEDTFKAKHIDNDSYYLHIPRYIHLNSLDVAMPEWRIGGVKDWGRAMQILDSDLWSSHSYYSTGKQELPILDESVLDFWRRNQDGYTDYLKEWAAGSIECEDREYWDRELEFDAV